MVNKNLLLIFVLMFANQAWGSDAIVPAQANELEIATAITDSAEKAQAESLSSQDVVDKDNQAILEKLYQTKIGKDIRKIQASPIVTKTAGELMNSRTSKPMISKFLKQNPDVANDMDNFVNPSLPQGADVTYKTREDAVKPYKTFNEFFYRKLSKKGMDARPIAKGDNVMSSPADCHLFVIPDLSQNPEFFVKGCKFDLERFLKGSMLMKLQDPKWVKKNPKLTAKYQTMANERESLVQQYNDGILLLFRLAPNDYHRFHFPFDCEPTAPEKINGMFESVNPIAYTPSVQPLTENLRHLIILKQSKESPTGFGDVLCMVVGAMMVGSIHETYLPNVPCIKGQEMGYFAFGGSSIVLIFKKGAIKIDQKFIDESKTLLDYEKIKGEWRKGGVVDYPETKIRMGERIGEVVPTSQADVTTVPLMFKNEWKLTERMKGSVVFTVNQTNDVVVALSSSMQDGGGMQIEKVVFKPVTSPTTYWISVNKGQDSSGAPGLAGGYVWRWVISWGMGTVIGQNELGNKTLSTSGAPYMFRYVGFGGIDIPDMLSNIKISTIDQQVK